MKKIVTLCMLFSVSLIMAQAYEGKDDNKFQVGANVQKNGSGLNLTYDYGLGESISIGVSSTYLLGVKEEIDADFGDRFDIKARFNANIGNVLQLGNKADIYPGLDFSLKNFGGHIGFRYFFSDGFGLYAEAGTPIAKYKSGTLTDAEKLHNQFVMNFGASFNF